MSCGRLAMTTLASDESGKTLINVRGSMAPKTTSVLVVWDLKLTHTIDKLSERIVV